MRVLCVLLAAAQAQGPPPGIPDWARGRPYSGGASQIVSPTVVATLMTRVQNDVHTLELLVLWRGKPGWFLEGNGHRGSGGGSGDVVSAEIEYSGRSLYAAFNRRSRIATIQDRKIDLNPDLNVVLVDKVEGSDAALIFSMARVDPALPAEQPQLPALLKRSDQLREFLQCHLTVSRASAQRTIDRLCAQVK
jgi:hypothetical protein